MGTRILLVDEGLYAARPDLLLTGRTLMGHEASKTTVKTILGPSLPCGSFHEDLESKHWNWASP